MQRSKILCINCSHYKDCSQQTRMYVNYCGQQMKNLKTKIDGAFVECRSHRGLVYKYEVFNPLKELQKATQLNVI